SRLDYNPMFAGAYATGWHSVKEQLDFLPYHYTVADVGIAVPALPANADLGAKLGTVQAAQLLVQLEARASRLNDEDKIRNLQNIYGLYVDRKMWDDITDLFTADGTLEIANLGVYDGPKNIRRALEIAGPAGLRRGELNDHLQYDTVVKVSADGMTARARGLELGMLGDVDKTQGLWTLSVFENDYVKGPDDIWRIRAMRLFPLLKSDYYQGWAKSQITDPKPPAANAPDHPVP